LDLDVGDCGETWVETQNRLQRREPGILEKLEVVIDAKHERLAGE
jgi:hypothetical protein